MVYGSLVQSFSELHAKIEVSEKVLDIFLFWKTHLYFFSIQFNSTLYAIKVLRFEVLNDKVIAKYVGNRCTLLHAQRQLCVVAVPLGQSSYVNFLKEQKKKGNN